MPLFLMRPLAAREQWVGIYKKYRDVLNADILHVRRADGQSLDSFMHADATLPQHQAFALIFNPTLTTLSDTFHFPLYYAGISNMVGVSHEGAAPVQMPLARDYTVAINVTLPPQSVTWHVFSNADAL